MKQRRTGDETRELVLHTAEQLFSRKGYAATTLDDIAAAVGIKRPSLLYHYPDKYSIYRAVLSRQFHEKETAILQKSRSEFADIRDYMNYLIDQTVDMYCDNPAQIRIEIYNLLAEDNATVNPRNLASKSVDLWRSAIKEGVASKVFRNVPVTHIFAIVGGTIGHYLLQSESVGLIDKKLAYATMDKKNINKMRETLRLAVWGVLTPT